MRPRFLSNAARNYLILSLNCFKKTSEQEKVGTISKLRPAYSFFLALNVILRPAQGFEFDMPALNGCGVHIKYM
jgi:hypothetical protein